MLAENKKLWLRVLLLLIGVCSLVLLRVVPVPAASGSGEQGGTLTIREHSSGNDTAKEAPFAIRLYEAERGYYTTAYVEENGSWTAKLPAGTYVVSEIVPMEYQCQAAEQTVTIADSQAQTLTFENTYSPRGYFRSGDTAVNKIRKGEVLNRYQIDVAAAVKEGYPSTYPVDMVMLLDVSSSMEEPMEGADGSIETRMKRMQDSFYAFLCKLKRNVSGDSRIAVITFSDKVETVLELRELGTMTEEELHAMVYGIAMGKVSTRTDLGMLQAYQLLQNTRIENRKQHLVLFTDGIPAGGMSLATMQALQADHLQHRTIAYYKSNTFRMMAETVNLSNALRGTGTVQSNYTIRGLVWEDRSFDFYGVGLKSGGSWMDLDSWEVDAEVLADYPSMFDQYDAMRDPAIWSSVKAGNYERTAQGLGVTVHAVGIFNPSDYVYFNERTQKTVDNYPYVEKIMEDCSDRYYLPADPDDLAKSFEQIFVDMVVPQNWKAELDIDANFEVLDHDGADVESLSDGGSRLSWSGDQIVRAWSDEFHPILREKKVANSEKPQITVTYYKTDQQGEIIREFDQQTEVYWNYEITKIR